MPRTLTYPEGWPAVIEAWEARRAPLVPGRGEGLPPADVDLAALAEATVPAEVPDPPANATAFARKRHALAREFAGKPCLALEHAMTIACLRRRRWPGHAPALFRRMWAEEADALVGMLHVRWQVSAALTFADHGTTEGERALGLSLAMLFKMMKIYEFERLHSGLSPDRPFRFGNRSRAALPMGINTFALRDGGLDINLLAPLFRRAIDEPVLGPLAGHLLDTLNADPGTVFRRLHLMRDRLLARDARNQAAGRPPGDEDDEEDGDTDARGTA
jgi:hypothetical protein